MRERAVVIGGGHNGLVTACYLAAGGLSVTVLEARDVVGGAAITEEFAPGFRNSALSYTVSLLAPAIIRDLRLAERGLRVRLRPVDNYVPMPDGNSLISVRDPQAFAAELGRHATADVDAYREYSRRLERIKPLVRHLLNSPPLTRPRPGNLSAWWAVGRKLWGLGAADLRFLQHFDPGLGPDWAQHEAAAVTSVLDVCEAFAPGFRRLIVGQRVYTPWQLEQRFGLIGGDIFHGRLAVDQLLAARPMLGQGHYRFVLDNLYLCGSGAHPGGGVSGLPGKLAAARMLRDLS